MKTLQKMGGVAALYEAAAYIIAMIFFIIMVDYDAVVDPVEKVALLVDNQLGLYILTLLSYVLFGFFLVILTLALHERLKAASPAIMQVATVFGLLWAGVVIASGMIFNVGMETAVNLYHTDPVQAGAAWLAIDTVSAGIGGGTEFIGGTWLLLVSWAALRSSRLPKALSYLGLVIGLAGVLSDIPGLALLGIVFGLTQIVWFIWLGIVLLRRSPSPLTQQSGTAVPRPRTTAA